MNYIVDHVMLEQFDIKVIAPPGSVVRDQRMSITSLLWIRARVSFPLILSTLCITDEHTPSTRCGQDIVVCNWASRRLCLVVGGLMWTDSLGSIIR